MGLNDREKESTPAISAPANLPSSPKWFAALGLVAGLGAVAASSCCVVPFGLAALGAGAGILGELEAIAEWRTTLLLVSIAAIVAGWGAGWLKGPIACAPGASCASHQHSHATLTLLLCGTITVVMATNWGYFDLALLKLLRGR
jgi:mercuric ion transport protein